MFDGFNVFVTTVDAVVVIVDIAAVVAVVNSDCFCS